MPYTREGSYLRTSGDPYSYGNSAGSHPLMLFGRLRRRLVAQEDSLTQLLLAVECHRHTA